MGRRRGPHLRPRPHHGRRNEPRRPPGLYYLIRHLRPQRVLEIGTLAGASTVHLAMGLAYAWPASPDIRLLTVDIVDVNDSEKAAWRRLGLAQLPRQAMERLGLGGVVEFRTGRSLDLLTQPGESFDLIFLDGDHRLQTVVAEIPRGPGAAPSRRIPAAARLLPRAPSPLARRQGDRRPSPPGRRLQPAGWRPRRYRSASCPGPPKRAPPAPA
jgi:hypothetical protein